MRTCLDFYFYLEESGRMVSDEEGLELASAEVARVEAMDAAREILAQSVRSGEDLDVQTSSSPMRTVTRSCRYL